MQALVDDSIEQGTRSKVLTGVAVEGPVQKGDKFGPYKMKSPLGVGRFGSVWKAECYKAKCPGGTREAAFKVIGGPADEKGDDWERLWDIADKESRGCSIQNSAWAKAEAMGMDPNIINRCILDKAKKCAEEASKCMTICPKGPTFPQLLDTCIRKLRIDANGDCHKPFLALDLIKGDQLDTFIAKSRRVTMSRDSKFKILKALVQGVRILTAEQTGFTPIVHRDIKFANLMIDSKHHVTFMDFGNALRVSSEANRTSEPNTFGSNAGEPFFQKFSDAIHPYDGAPPEVYLAEQNFAACAVGSFDMWSLGVVMYRLMTAAPDWEIAKYKSHARMLEKNHKLDELNPRWSESEAEAAWAKVNAWREKMSSNDAMEQAVSGMLSIDPCARPSPVDVINRLEGLEVIYTVEVIPMDGSYGISWGDPDPTASRLFVRPSDKGSAFAAGVRKGDVLHTVNGLGGNMAAPNLKDLLGEEAKSKGTLTLQFYSKIGVGSKDIRTKSGSLGANIKWGGNFPVVLSFATGSQLQATGVEPLDEITAVNGVSLDGKPQKEGEHLITQSPNPRILTIRRSPKA